MPACEKPRVSRGDGFFALDRVTEDRHGVLFDLPQGKEKRKIIFEKQQNLTKMKCENCREKSM